MISPLLVLCEYGSLNGGERSLLSALDVLVPQGLELRVAAPGGGPLAEALRIRGWPHLPLELHEPPADADRHGPTGLSRSDPQPVVRLPLEERRRRISAVVAATRAAVVHANSLSMSRLAGPVAAELSVPAIGHLRDILRVNRQVVADLNRHDRLLAVSQATRRWYIAQGVEAARLHVVYNGVDLQRFQPRSASGYLHRELGLPAGVPLVAAIGQIGLRKGLDVFLSAAQAVAARDSEVRFLIIGHRYSQKAESVEFEADLQWLAARPPLAGRCHFLGLREDTAELLNELTLLVHAARQEPLGRVLLEAAASGTPVIATAVGGTPEIFLEDGGAAQLVPPGDAAVLAAAMLRLLGDENARQGLARAARQRAEQAFDVRRAAAALCDHYRAVALESAL